MAGAMCAHLCRRDGKRLVHEEKRTLFSVPLSFSFSLSCTYAHVCEAVHGDWTTRCKMRRCTHAHESGKQCCYSLLWSAELIKMHIKWPEPVARAQGAHLFSKLNRTYLSGSGISAHSWLALTSFGAGERGRRRRVALGLNCFNNPAPLSLSCTRGAAASEREKWMDARPEERWMTHYV